MVYNESMARTSFTLVVLGIAGAMALLLGIVGIYGVVAYVVLQRTREIGIRTALGASPRRVIAGVLGRAVTQVAIGVAIGAVPGGVLLSLQAREYASGAVTAGSITAAIALFIVGVAVVACVVPVRRALRIQPTDALRVE